MAELRAELIQFDSGPPDTLAEGTSAARKSAPCAVHALSATGAQPLLALSSPSRGSVERIQWFKECGSWVMQIQTDRRMATQCHW